MIKPVALASGRFEAFAINDRDLTATILDQPGAIQFSEGRRDPGTPHAEHRRKEFMRHWYCIRVNAVARHQHPSGAALFNRVETVTGSGLRGEVQNAFGEAQHHSAHRRALMPPGTERHSCAARLWETA